MSSASSSSLAARRATTATCAPAAARTRDVALPMPLEAPVTIATVPSSAFPVAGAMIADDTQASWLNSAECGIMGRLCLAPEPGMHPSHQSETEWPQKGTSGHKIKNPFGIFMLFCGYVPVGVSHFDEALASGAGIGREIT